MNKNHTRIDNLISEYMVILSRLPIIDLGAELKVISALKVSNELLFLMRNLNINPYERISEVIDNEINCLKGINFSRGHRKNATRTSHDESVSATRKLYETIWTIYNNETYDHSMQLCLKRFEANGFDKKFFSGKVVFDGGCGTGRFCVAAALMGARKVYGMDLGEQSLDFAKNKAKEYQIDHSVEFIEGDVTNLDKFPDNFFDLVVSNGVLHHTIDPTKGLSEHYRVLKSKGIMWLYLYGKNGLLWKVYGVLKDILKDVGVGFTSSFLLKLEIRQGLIYSFMDNVFAPIRNYYNTSEVLAMLREFGDFRCKDMRGINFLDDYTLQINSEYGRDLLGEECEVRQLIVKK